MRKKKPDLTNKKTLAVSSLSGHGAALFLSVAVPFQIVGRVEWNMLGWAFLGGAVGVIAFGFGAYFSASCVELSEQDTDESKADYARYFQYSLWILLAAGIVVFLILFITGANILTKWEEDHPRPTLPADYPWWLHQTPLQLIS